MEGIGAVEHCKSIFSRPGDSVRAYIRQIVTDDDDSTTRANLRHSLKDVFDAQYGDGGWTKSDVWPRVDNDPKKIFVKDNGLMPLWVPEVLLYLCDISHRVKVIGSMCYDIKKGKEPSPPPVIAVLDDKDDSEDGSPRANATPKNTKKKAASKHKRPPQEAME